MPQASILSPLGRIDVTTASEAITSVLFVDEAIAQPATPSDPLLQECIHQLEGYFSGKLKHFDLPLAPQGTPFQVRVWDMLQLVGHGSTASYGELAVRLGDAKLTRAVGTANGSNPIGIIIPCHRIIGADGSLTGYAGGLWRKQWLLAHESQQMTLF